MSNIMTLGFKAEGRLTTTISRTQSRQTLSITSTTKGRPSVANDMRLCCERSNTDIKDQSRGLRSCTATSRESGTGFDETGKVLRLCAVGEGRQESKGKMCSVKGFRCKEGMDSRM